MKVPIAISVAEFCDRYSLGKTSAFLLIKKGELDTFKIGRRTLILMDSVEAMIARNAVRRDV